MHYGDVYGLMFEVIQVGRSGLEGFGGPVSRNALAQLPGLRIHRAKVGCPAIDFTWLLGSICPVLAGFLASGQGNNIFVSLRPTPDFIKVTYS